MNSTDKLKKYVGYGRTSIIRNGILVVFSIVVAIGVTLLIFLADLVSRERDVFILIISGGIFTFYFVSRTIKAIKEGSILADTFKKLEQKGLLDDAVDDFNKAVSVNNGRVMIGQNYLFLKMVGIILFEEIREVYLTSDKQHNKSLIMKLKNGRVISLNSLCGWNFKDICDSEINQLIQVLRMKNQNITFDETIMRMLQDQ